MSFSHTLEWPELSSLERFFVAARLEFAWEILSVLNTGKDGEALVGYPTPERCTTAELLQWLLLDIWPSGCGRFLQTQKWKREQAAASRALHPCSVLEAGQAACVA